MTLNSAYNTLRADYHPVHSNPEGPLSEAWRKSTCISFWGTCTEEEIKDMVQNVTRMKNEGTLQKYVDTHEKNWDSWSLAHFCFSKGNRV